MIYSVRLCISKPKTLFSLFFFCFHKKKKKLKEKGLPYYPKNQENKASHSSTDLEGKFLKEKELQVLRMQYYHFKVMRSEKKLLSCKSTVNSLYSGHCRDLELLSSLARVHYGGNLFQSNICNLWEERENGDPQSPSLFPFLPSYLHPSIPYPFDTCYAGYILWFWKSRKTFWFCDIFTTF